MKVVYKKTIEKEIEISQILVDLFKETFTGFLWHDKKTLTLSDMQGLRATLHTVKSDYYMNENKESLISELSSLILQLHNYKSVEFTIYKSNCPENRVS